MSQRNNLSQFCSSRLQKGIPRTYSLKKKLTANKWKESNQRTFHENVFSIHPISLSSHHPIPSGAVTVSRTVVIPHPSFSLKEIPSRHGMAEEKSRKILLIPLHKLAAWVFFTFWLGNASFSDDAGLIHFGEFSSFKVGLPENLLMLLSFVELRFSSLTILVRRCCC